MRILVDENIPMVTVRALRDLGHDVLDVRSTEKEGSPDRVLWEIAQAEERLLISTDRGFSLNRSRRHHGMLIVCLRRPNRLKIHQKIMAALARFRDEQWSGLTVILRDAAQAIWRAE